MSIEQYIHACLDGKDKTGILDNPVDFVTIGAIMRYTDQIEGHSMHNDRKSGCLTDTEIAAFIEQKKKHPEYARFVGHMADCESCRRKALEAEALLSIEAMPAPGHIIENSFADARARAGSKQLKSIISGYRVPLAAAAALVLAVTAVLYFAVLRPAGGPAQVTFYMGNISITRGGKLINPAIKLRLQDGDVIRTGPASFILLQSDESAVIRITENSTLTMKSINNTLDRNLSLNGGKVLSRVKKLGKNASYSIETSTIVVAVRGTEFSVQDQSGISTVAVRSGSVEISRMEGAEKTLIPAGTAHVAPGTKETRPISDSESLELENLSKIPIIEGINSKSDVEIGEIIRSHLGTEGMPQNTYAEMKAKYSHVDTITLYNNRVITGVIISRGANYTIVTTGGIILVPDRQIRNIKVH